MANKNKATGTKTLHILKILDTECTTNEVITLLLSQRAPKVSGKIDFYSLTLD